MRTRENVAIAVRNIYLAGIDDEMDKCSIYGDATKNDADDFHSHRHYVEMGEKNG